MKKILFLLLFFITNSLHAQLFDNFSDGDFSQDPAWAGESEFFKVTDNQLQSNGPAATAQIYLSTANVRASNTEWRFLVDMRFEPSSSNQLRAFLISDQANLKGDLNGYFLEIGQTGDEQIKIYKKTGASNSLIFTGSTLLTGNVKVNIRVRRDEVGNWFVFSDNSGGQGYISEGNFTDNTFTTTDYFGVLCSFTSTRNNLFYFDNFYIGDFVNDVTPPQLLSADALLSNTLSLQFDEEINDGSLSPLSNFSVDNGIGVPVSAVVDPVNNQKINLSFNKYFQEGNSYQVSATNIGDLTGNIAGSQVANFTYRNDLDSVMIISANLLDVYFDISPSASAAVPANYVLSNGIGAASNVIIDQSNSKLVHLAFTNKFKEGQLHTLNISNVVDAEGQALKLPAFSFIYDIKSPTIKSLTVVDNRRIRLLFDERLNGASATNLSNYVVNNGIGNPNMATMQMGDSAILLQFTNAFTNEVVNRVSVIGVRDFAGNAITRTINVNFVYDTRPPFVRELMVLSADSLLIRFSETVNKSVAETASNYIVNGPGNPISATRLPYDSTLVLLDFSSNFPLSSANQLVITKAEDLRGNKNSVPIAINFNTLNPSLALLTVLSENAVKLKFSKALSAPTAQNPANYLLNNTISPSTVQLINGEPSSVILDFEEKFRVEGDTIGILAMQDEQGNVLSGPTEKAFSYNSMVSSIKILSSNTIQIEFSVSLSTLKAETEAHYVLSGGLNLPALALVDSENPAIVRLIFSQPLVVGNSYQLNISGLRNIFEQVIPASNNTLIYDLVKPNIISISQTFNDQIDLVFSEAMAERTITTLTQYSLSGGLGNPSAVEFDKTNPDRVSLIFNNLIDQAEYLLIVSGLEDLAGNLMDAQEIEFTYIEPYVPQFGDLLITEIMANPKEGGILPVREYVEIYNRSNKSINLKGLQFSDASSSTTINTGAIDAGEYIILCTNSSAPLFASYGKAIGVSSFPTLNISGDQLSIINTDKEMVFTVNYSDSWYQDIIKKDAGGWALEMVDTNNPCGEASNWTASIAPAQGTPGMANSVTENNPDNTGPKLLKAYAVDQNLVDLRFNEKLSPLTLQQASYDLSNNLEVIGASLSEDQTRLYLTLSPNLQTGITYSITITAASDCNGNMLSAEHHTASFHLAETALVGDVVLNEILFNPRTGGVDFVEIYNHSDKHIDLKGWHLGNQTPDNEKVIISDTYVMAPQEYLVITSNPALLQLEYPAAQLANAFTLASMPSYSDTEGTAVIMNAHKDTFDLFSYTDDMHFSLISDKNGVSLEKIAADKPSDANNWRSAASVTGTNTAFATPGYKNSQSGILQGSTAKINIEPQVFTPDNSGSGDFTNIYYNFDAPGYVASIKIFDASGRLMKLLVNNESLPAEGFIRWDGDLDNGGVARVGYYMVLLEIFDTNGRREVIKERVAVASQF